jgi:hypothetical protein
VEDDHEGNALVGAFWGVILSLPIWAVVIYFTGVDMSELIPRLAILAILFVLSAGTIAWVRNSTR